MSHAVSLPEISEPIALTYEQAARKLSISKGSLRNLVDAREVAIVRIGRSVRFAESELRRFVASRMQVA